MAKKKTSRKPRRKANGAEVPVSSEILRAAERSGIPAWFKYETPFNPATGEVNQSASLMTFIKAMYEAPNRGPDSDDGRAFLENVLLTLADEVEVLHEAAIEGDVAPAAMGRVLLRLQYRIEFAVEVARRIDVEKRAEMARRIKAEKAEAQS